MLLEILRGSSITLYCVIPTKFTLSFLALSSTDGYDSMAVGEVSFQDRLRSDFAGLETDSNEAALVWGWPWNQTTRLHLMFLQHVEASIALAMEPARSKEHLYLLETLGIILGMCSYPAWLYFSVTLTFKNEMGTISRCYLEAGGEDWK